jgi:putative aldouronate transport system substrate-binding protein
MVTAIISGCSKTTDTPSDTPTEKPTETAKDNTDNTDTEKEEEVPTFTGYPMDKQDTELTWWVGQGFTLNEAYATPEESPFHTLLQEMVGVKINWQFPTAGTDGTQAMNLMLASETLPDIIFNNIMGDIERYMEEGIVRDLSDHIEEWSPAFYSLIKSKDIYDKYMKTDSGKYYGYGFFREGGGWNDTYQGPLVRQDWLDAQGLKSPETIADWDNVLKVFKDKYDAVFSAPWSRFKATGISGAFGAYTLSDFKLFVDGNNKVQLANIQPEYKDYLAKLNEWWKAGLIDKDLTTNDDAGVRTKALNGVTGLAYSSMGQLSNWVDDAEKDGKGAIWKGLQYPKGNDGKLSMVFGGYGIGSVVSVITTSCPDEKLETAMRVLDYAYTDEGNLYWNYGKQGNSWDYDAKNEPAYLDIVTKDPNGLNNAISKFGGSTWSGSCIQATKLLYLKNKPAAIEANDLWFYPNEEVSAKWNFPSGVTLTTEESNTLDEVQSAISTYVSEMAVKFINGEEPIDNFDAYVQQVNGMGLDTVLQVRQAAYDRFLAR